MNSNSESNALSKIESLLIGERYDFETARKGQNKDGIMGVVLSWTTYGGEVREKWVPLPSPEQIEEKEREIREEEERAERKRKEWEEERRMEREALEERKASGTLRPFNRDKLLKIAREIEEEFGIKAVESWRHSSYSAHEEWGGMAGGDYDTVTMVEVSRWLKEAVSKWTELDSGDDWRERLKSVIQSRIEEEKAEKEYGHFLDKSGAKEMTHSNGTVSLEMVSGKTGYRETVARLNMDTPYTERLRTAKEAYREQRKHLKERIRDQVVRDLEEYEKHGCFESGRRPFGKRPLTSHSEKLAARIIRMRMKGG